MEYVSKRDEIFGGHLSLILWALLLMVIGLYREDTADEAVSCLFFYGMEMKCDEYKGEP